MIEELTYGEYVGDTCYRNGCDGIIQAEENDNCYCHIVSPCYYCETRVFYCDKCGWNSEKDKY